MAHMEDSSLVFICRRLARRSNMAGDSWGCESPSAIALAMANKIQAGPFEGAPYERCPADIMDI